MVMLNSGRWNLHRRGAAEPPELAGLQLWRTDLNADPNVSHNPTDKPIEGLGSLGIQWAPGQLALHPGPAGRLGALEDGRVFANPQDFFAQSIRQMAAERLYGLNALRANPSLVGYSLTFRELKPGTTDAMFEALAPLRLCLFAEPLHVYRGAEEQGKPGEIMLHSGLSGDGAFCGLRQ